MSEPDNDVIAEQEKENSNCGLGLEEGACGGIQGLRPSTPFSDGDNLSMEVGFSEGSSHHASDISSVSYQNLLDDEVLTQNLSRRGSEESVDSYLPDYCDDLRGDGALESSSQNVSSYSDRISDRISAPIQMRGDQIYVATDDISIGPKKTSHSVISDPGPDLRVDHPRMSSLPPNSDSLTVQDSFRKHELITLREQQRSKSLPPNESKEDRVKKRSSLEIRNNIPISGEVKNYEKDVDKLIYSNQGAKPKIKKQSPGLACRVEDANTADPIEIDHEMDKATKIISDLIQVSKANSVALNAQCKKLNEEMDKQTAMFNGEHKTLDDSQSNVVQPSKTDVENEYEYVKYSRVQEGNSYVGKRLAYSSSETDEGKKQNIENGSNSNLIESSREGTPEKFSSHNVTNLDNIQGNLSEDMLTEIPLNGPDSSNILDDRKLFTLSPENTECDSVEIESVTSEGDDKSPVGMPIVEDGLSSSQTSDVEDNNTNNKTSSAQSTPKKQLQLKQQKELEKKLYGVECETMKPREMDAEAIIDDLKLKREALDNAIHDIKVAIQKSKGVALEAPYKEEDTEDPVWIKRDEDIVIPRGESTQEILHSREELDRQGADLQATVERPVAADRQVTPERVSVTDRQAEAAAERQAIVEKMTKEHEEVYHTEESKLLGSGGNQYKRSNGKVYQTPKGYDSDDEDDDSVQYTRRNKGKKYSQIPKDESVSHHSESSHYSDGDLSSVRKIDSVSMYGDTNMYAYTQDSHSDRRNSESQCSSEDFCSDTESLTKHAYIRKPREGDFDTDEETDRLLEKQYQGNQYVDIPELTQPPVNRNLQAEKRRSRAKEVQINDPENPSVLIEGVLFRARYLGSTQLISEGQPSKAMRMMQAQEAVGRIKVRFGLGTENK